MGKKIAKRAENSGRSGAKRAMPVGRRFQPGVSGNPGGRPRTGLLSQALRQKLGDLVPNDPQGRTYAQKIADALVERASRGDAESFRTLGDRAEGKPSQSVALTSTPSFSEFDGWSKREVKLFAETGRLPARFESEESDENAGKTSSSS